MINRRKFVTTALVSGAGLAAGKVIGMPEFDSVTEAEQAASGLAAYDIMKDTLKYRKIDAHNHVHLFDGGPEGNLHFADRLGIDKMIISRPVTKGPNRPEDFIKSNSIILKAMKESPDRFAGQVTVNVQYQKEALEEINRCTGEGMVGLKTYHQVKISDPLFFPIVERMIELKMMIHMHSNCQLGMAGYRMKYDTGINPNTSIPEDFVAIATRYPEAMFQYAHIGGGGDWEYACKAFKHLPNVYVDTSGSNNPEGMVDGALKILGEDRLLFGTDNCYYQSVGKVLCADLTEDQRNKIFFENYNNVLKKSGRNFNLTR